MKRNFINLKKTTPNVDNVGKNLKEINGKTIRKCFPNSEHFVRKRI